MNNRENYYFRNAVPALLVMILVFVLPLGAVLLRAFSGTIGSLAAVFTDPHTWKLLGFTVLESLLSAAISVLLALPFALFFSRYRFLGRKAIITMSDAAFALPSILVVLGFVIYLGNNGIVNNVLASLFGEGAKIKFLYSFQTIILAHVYLNFPVAFSLLTAALSSMPDTEEKASMLLGVSKTRTFWAITFPKMRGTVVSAFTLIFLFCFPSFLIVMSLGGNPRYYTMEAEIYRRTYVDANPSASASLAAFSFLIMATLLLITGYGREEKKVTRRERVLQEAKGSLRVKAFLVSLVIFLFMAPPLLSILYRAFYTKDGVFTLKAWTDILNKSTRGSATALSAIFNSIVLALASSFAATELAVHVAFAGARRKSTLIPLLTSLPMAAGSVTLGLGFNYLSTLISSRSIVIAYFMVFLAHMVVVMPFAVRTLLPGARRIPERLSLAAATLGASPNRAYRTTERPLIRPYKRRAFAFAFALSLGEVNATLSLSEGKVTTLPILIYKMINQYNYQGAAALAVILLTLALVVFTIGESGGKENGLS